MAYHDPTFEEIVNSLVALKKKMDSYEADADTAGPSPDYNSLYTEKFKLPLSRILNSVAVLEDRQITYTDFVKGELTEKIGELDAYYTELEANAENVRRSLQRKIDYSTALTDKMNINALMREFNENPPAEKTFIDFVWENLEDAQIAEAINIPERIAIKYEPIGAVDDALLKPLMLAHDLFMSFSKQGIEVWDDEQYKAVDKVHKLISKYKSRFEDYHNKSLSPISIKLDKKKLEDNIRGKIGKFTVSYDSAKAELETIMELVKRDGEGEGEPGNTKQIQEKLMAMRFLESPLIPLLYGVNNAEELRRVYNNLKSSKNMISESGVSITLSNSPANWKTTVASPY